MSSQIRTGEVFLDDRGVVAQLHGCAPQRFGSKYWAFGENRESPNAFGGVNAYSSADLAEWMFEGVALQPGEGYLAVDRVVERPKVLYNTLSSEYVMFLHLDNRGYEDALLGIATSDQLAGPYTLVSAFRPGGNESRDIGVFQEGETGYLLSEDRSNGLRIYELSRDYRAIRRTVATLQRNGGGWGYESPALIKSGSVYYLFGSDLTYWDANDNQYCTAEQLEGPWSAWTNFAPEGTSTFSSQISAVVPVGSAECPAFVFIGDRWTPDNLSMSPPVWLPLQIHRGTASLEWRDQWKLTDVFPTARDEASTVQKR